MSWRHDKAMSCQASYLGSPHRSKRKDVSMTGVRNDASLERFLSVLGERLGPVTKATLTPGLLVGVSRGGRRGFHASGIANLNTGAAMTTDTAFLLGSVTKVLTTALLLRQVERGLVDLEAPVVRLLPEFRLNQPGLAEQVTVRQ